MDAVAASSAIDSAPTEGYVMVTRATSGAGAGVLQDYEVIHVADPMTTIDDLAGALAPLGFAEEAMADGECRSACCRVAGWLFERDLLSAFRSPEDLRDQLERDWGRCEHWIDGWRAERVGDLLRAISRSRRPRERLLLAALCTQAALGCLVEVVQRSLPQGLFVGEAAARMPSAPMRVHIKQTRPRNPRAEPVAVEASITKSMRCFSVDAEGNDCTRFLLQLQVERSGDSDDDAILLRTSATKMPYYPGERHADVGC